MEKLLVLLRIGYFNRVYEDQRFEHMKRCQKIIRSIEEMEIETKHLFFDLSWMSY
jgi:hypothetical protein